MALRWLLLIGATFCANCAFAQRLPPPGPLSQTMKAPHQTEPAPNASPVRTASPTRTSAGQSQGVLIDMSSNLGRGVLAEMTEDYKDAIKLLTLAIKEEQAEVIKLGLAHRFRGLAYKHLGRREEALNDFLEVIRIQPQLDLGYYDAGVIYNLTGRHQAAVAAMTRAIDLRHDDRGLARRRSERGNAYFHLGQFKRAESDFVVALRLDPREPDVLNNVAWFRATCPDAAFRNGREAVELAARACALDRWKDADEIDTLAAAYAESGNFAEAERYQQKALSLLSADEALRPKFQARLEQFRAKQPVRQQIGES